MICEYVNLKVHTFIPHGIVNNHHNYKCNELGYLILQFSMMLHVPT